MPSLDDLDFTHARKPFHVLGREIGTYTGWDQADTFAIQIYNFEPAEEIDLPFTANLTIDFGTGKVTWFDEVTPPDYEPIGHNGWVKQKDYKWEDHYHWRDIVDTVKHVRFQDLEEENGL